MKFSALNSDLIKALSTVNRAVSSKSTIPILECVHITADNDRLTFKASDMQISISTVIPADVKSGGKVIVVFKTLMDIIRTYPNETVYFDVNENNCIDITCERSEVRILGKNVEDYPEFDKVKDNDFIGIENEVLKELIRDTAFAAAPYGYINSILSGVLAEIESGYITFTALDGYKMAHKKHKINYTPKEKISAVLPASALMEIMKILSLNQSAAEFLIKNNRFIVNISDTQVISNLLEGHFINYQTLIPTEVKTVVKVKRNELAVCMERASLITDESHNSMIKLVITEEGIMMNSSSERGNINEQINVTKSGDDIKTAFNSRYFIEILKNITEEKIIIEFKDALSPCLIRPIENDDFLYLIMPVRYVE